jgi:hypothetical protein
MYMIDVLLHNGAHIRFEDSSDSTIEQLRAHNGRSFPKLIAGSYSRPTTVCIIYG